MSEIRPSPTSVRVSHSILVTALNVVIHSWKRDSKTQYGKERERDVFLMLWATTAQQLIARESSHQWKFISFLKGVVFASVFLILSWV